MVDFKRMLDPEWQAKYKGLREAEDKAEAEKQAKFFQPGKYVIQHRGHGRSDKVLLKEKANDGWWVIHKSSNGRYEDNVTFASNWELSYLPTEEKTF